MQLHAEHFNRALLIPEGFSGDLIVEYIDRNVSCDAPLTALRQVIKHRRTGPGGGRYVRTGHPGSAESQLDSGRMRAELGLGAPRKQPAADT